MPSPHRPRLTYANVMSTLAVGLLVAGGVGYAAVTLPDNSVGTKQLKNNAVTGAKVKNGSLGTADLSAAARASLQGQTGPAGPAGDTGQAGATGATGAAGATGGQGVPGPTASGFAQTTVDTTLTPGSPNATVIRLTTATTTSGALVLAEEMRVFISAHVVLYKGTGIAGSVGNATCQARSASVGGAFSTLLGTPSLTLPDLPSGTAAWGVLSVSNSIVLQAGSYDFDIRCFASNSPALGQAVITADEATLSVVAAAT